MVPTSHPRIWEVVARNDAHTVLFRQALAHLERLTFNGASHDSPWTAFSEFFAKWFEEEPPVPCRRATSWSDFSMAEDKPKE